jgi:tRNA(Ile)-lysidine synthase
LRRKEFAAKVWSKLVSTPLFTRGDRVLAAVSGGADSVCLAHFLAHLSRRRGFSLRIVHVHHGLRGRDADRDAEFTARLGKALGLETAVIRIKIAGKGEAAARRARYAALVKEARRRKCGKIALAHQLDDQAETVLLNLIRGSKFAGIPARRPLAPGIEAVRPLLPVSRSEVLTYLKLHGLKHRVDKTNRDDAFTRNWIRRKVLPLLESRNPRIREHLSAAVSRSTS